MPVRNQLRDEGRLDAGLGVRHELRRLGVPVGPEAEHRGRPPERFGQVRAGARCRCRRRRAAAGRRSSRKPFPSGPRTCSSSPRLELRRARGSRARSRSIRNASSPRGARQRLIGRGSSRPGASSMKNCPGTPGSSPPRLDTQQRVRADLLVRDDAKPLASHARSVPAVPAATATPRYGRLRSRAPRQPRRTAS